MARRIGFCETLFTFYVLSIVFLGCSSDPLKLNVGDVCQDKFLGKTVEIEGKIYAPNAMLTYGTMFMHIRGENYESGPLLLFSPGTGKNQMETVPDIFSSENIRIHDNMGQVIRVSDKVRVIGEVDGVSQRSCKLRVEEIEKLSSD